MTDNEIIKELQAASEWFTEHGRNTNTAIVGICDRAIDLINRQKAEIEMLKGWERLLKAESHAPIIKKARAEAVKEFAERLVYTLCVNNEENTEIFDYDYTLETIDNLVKEFTEGG